MSKHTPRWCLTCANETGEGCECERLIFRHPLDGRCSHAACEGGENNHPDCGDLESGTPTDHCVGMDVTACLTAGHDVRDCQ